MFLLRCTKKDGQFKKDFFLSKKFFSSREHKSRLSRNLIMVYSDEIGASEGEKQYKKFNKKWKKSYLYPELWIF